MDLQLDLHTHTLVSGHAYSTLQENIQVAKEKGLKYLGTSEHGPSLPGAPHIYYFQNMRVIPREMNGVKILRGVEANIIDFNGSIDMIPATLKYVDYIIASTHIPCLTPGTSEENTSAIIGAMKHPKVNIIGHPDDDRFPINMEAIVKAAKENNVLLELNNNSLDPTGFRENARDNIIDMLKRCMKHKVSIVVSSDAHISSLVGEFGYAEEILTELNFPEDLIINLKPQKFLSLINFAE